MRRFRKANISRLRGFAESLMADTCTVTHPGRGTTDPVTGHYDPDAGKPVYEGKCKVQSHGGIGAENTSLGSIVVSTMMRVDFPIGTTGLSVNDIVTITVSDDVTLLGARFRLVSQESRKTFATAMRWNVKEVSLNVGDD
jgi:hypothetical protein